MSTRGRNNDQDSGMSPFAHLLHDLRMRHNIRQSELAERMGYEQSYISALELGIKGPPSPELVQKLVDALDLSDAEADDLQRAVQASQRKLTIDPDVPQDIYWLLDDLRAKLPKLSPVQVRVIKDVLSLSPAHEACWPGTSRRLRRRGKEEAEM